jgi:arylsulfatase A-like enzyme
MKDQALNKSLNLALAGLVSVSCSAGTEKKNIEKPNILFIAIDDLKPILGCYGDTLVKTPNMDKLAARGMVFVQNYCQQAVSGPTRASLMTGKRPDYTKVWDLKTRMRDVNPDILTIPEYFKQQGYISAGIGKIYDPRCIDNYKDQDKPSWSIPYFDVPDQYYYNNQPPAFDYYQNPETRKEVKKFLDIAKEQGIKGNKLRSFVLSHVMPSTECMDLPDNAYVDGAAADRAVNILADLAGEKKPFFFAVGFHRPHLPFVVPKKYWDLYTRDEMPLAKFQEHAKNSPEIAYTNSFELRSYTDIPPLASFTDLKINRIGLPENEQKKLIHGYYASVSYADAQVGKVLHALDSLGLEKNTIIVLWGDHGWHLGDHDLWCKHTNFEQAARAPLLISVPGMKPGKTNSLTEFVDIFPTLCDLSNLKTPANLDGKSLLPLIKKPESSIMEYAVSQFPHEGSMGYSIRTERYRLTYWMKKGFRSSSPFSNDLIVAKELYDYKTDPLETVNVVNDKKYSKTVVMMEAFMSEYLKNQCTTLHQ